MKSYLVKLKPLEPYFFGGERTFNFGVTEDGSKKSYTPYFISSEDIMSQTSILGVLRFLILKINGKLNSTKESTKDLIGESSFSFEKKNQNFGKIYSISPLFLIHKNQEYYIKTPFNHKILESKENKNKKYTPFKMEKFQDNTIIQSSKMIESFPMDKEYDPKEGIANTFLNISNGDIFPYEDNDLLFRTNVQTGIKKTLTGNKEDQNESFFKKEYKILNEDFIFACFVEAEELPQKETVIMGQGKSLFEFSCEEKANDLEVKVKEFFFNYNKNQDEFYYALSDLKPNNAFFEKVKGFYITEKKDFRNLITDLSQKSYYKFINKSRLYTLMKAGSVFYFDCKNGEFCGNELFESEYEKVGFNKLIKVGGEKNEG